MHISRRAALRAGKQVVGLAATPDNRYKVVRCLCRADRAHIPERTCLYELKRPYKRFDDM